jgi:hypothetical protein
VDVHDRGEKKIINEQNISTSTKGVEPKEHKRNMRKLAQRKFILVTS